MCGLQLEDLPGGQAASRRRITALEAPLRAIEARLAQVEEDLEIQATGDEV